MDAAEIEATLHELTAAQLVPIIVEANAAYWDRNEQLISDPLYDRVVERLRTLQPDAPILSKMGPTAADGEILDAKAAEDLPVEQRFGAPVRHERPMLSLDKAYTAEEVHTWAGKFEGELLVMPKLDGIACSIRYDAEGQLRLAATRGSGTEGEDITMNVLLIPGVPRAIAQGPVEVRGEIYMRLSAFEKYKADFSNPRNTAAGGVRQKHGDGSRAADLSFGAYDIIGLPLATERDKMAMLRELSIPTADHEFVEREGIAGSYEAMSAKRADLDYEIDGVVYRADLVAEQERMGWTSHHPRYALAFKFQGDTGETTLLDVEWGVSRTGTITPMAILDPIELSGAMIGRAGLSNLTRFRALQLTRGARVEVTRRGGVIPYVEKVVAPGEGEFQVPTQCPACGGSVVVRQKRDGEFLQCEHPEQCVTARLRELEHFAKVVDIQGFGPKIVTQVVEAGLLTTPADYFRLSHDELTSLERLGSKSAQNLLGRIDAKRTIPLATFLESLGIDHLGPSNARLLANNFLSLSAIRTLTQEALVEVKGIKEAIADALIDGLAVRAERIDELLQVVTVPDADPPPPPPEGEAAGPLAGQSFVFTGTLESFDRKTAQARVKALGGEAPSGVSKSLTALVVGAGKGAKSSKQKKAEKLNGDGATIAVLTEEAFLERIGGMGDE